MDKKFEANVFGCSGENKSPALKWSGAPKDTKSFAGHGVRPRRAHRLRLVALVGDQHPRERDGAQAGRGQREQRQPAAGCAPGAHRLRRRGWGGACPPPGDKPHRYVFTVYALKTDKLDIPADATAALAGFMINANALGKASFTARYGRPKAK
jgi:phosphatidylethanolamine-binding protein (PEBP) family uncharacterized protein